MKALKYRAWLKKESRMVEVSGLDWEKKDLKWVHVENRMIDIDNVELMMRLNYQDSKGNPVYEGDILASRHQLVYLKWDVCGLWFFLVNGEKYSAEVDGVYLQHFEVIGNIHQNSDILNVDYEQEITQLKQQQYDGSKLF